MKKVILAMALVFGLAIVVNAQQVKRMNPFSIQAMDEVGATDEQKQKFNDLTKEYKEKLAAIRGNTTLSEEEKKKQHMELNKYRNTTYYSQILTQEQAKQIQANHKARVEAAKKEQ